MKLLSLISIVTTSVMASGPTECLPIGGSLIRGEDLAAIIPEFAAAPTRTIAPAPMAGIKRSFSRAELARLANRFGLTDFKANQLPESVCFAYPVSPPTRAGLTEAIQKAVGVGIAFELTDYSLFPVPAGDLVFKNASLRPDRRDGTRLLAGFVRYAGRQAPVWARVRALAKPQGFVATKELRPGMKLDSSDMRIADVEAAAGTELRSVSDLGGMTPRRRIEAGTVLTLNMFVRAPEIGTGDNVLVKVTAGAANLSFESRAETSGQIGDQILLKNPASGQRFRAKIDGRGRASLTLGPREVQ
jgi:flagella basal body P-ring formation protein FlgA